MTTQYNDFMAQGDLAIAQGEVDRALRAWRCASALRPRCAAPHIKIAKELKHGRRLLEAETAFATVLLLAPRLRTARFQMGLVQFSLGRSSVAAVTWRPLHRLSKGSPIRSFVEGFEALAAEDFQTALLHFEAGVDANGADASMNSDITEVMLAIRLVQTLNRVGKLHDARSRDAKRFWPCSNHRDSIH